MSQRNLYIISGLATDERIFKNIHFPASVEVNFIAWKIPLRNETLDAYIDRLLKEIDRSKPIILLGLSFGGVAVQEIAQKINPIGTIIISSITSSKDLPWYFRYIGNLKANRIIPFGLLKFPNFGANWIFGAKSKDDKKMLAGIIKDADVTLLKWSVEQILNWKSKGEPKNLFHIHGDNDKLLPLKNNKTNVIIKNGGHLMIYNKAKEIERILENVLAQKIYSSREI